MSFAFTSCLFFLIQITNYTKSLNCATFWPRSPLLSCSNQYKLSSKSLHMSRLSFTSYPVALYSFSNFQVISSCCNFETISSLISLYVERCFFQVLYSSFQFIMRFKFLSTLSPLEVCSRCSLSFH